MILKEFECVEWYPKDTWRLDNFKLDKINLITGKNASGKTKVLTNIISLVQLLRGRFYYSSSLRFKATFLNKNNSVFSYFLHLDPGQVLEERLVRDGQILIDRKVDKNFIYSEKEQKLVSFKPLENKLTIEVRRNEEEYPYLEELLYWADNVYVFGFSGIPFDQLDLLKLFQGKYEIIFNDLNTMLDILEEKKNSEEEFKKVILKDMSLIGYDLENYKLQNPGSKHHSILIKEKESKLSISHRLLSAGMYRVFSILVIINHYLMMKKPCTLIIDDLGEGLDFDRSSKLTKLLFDKVKDSEVQLIVTSNDRFLMNAVDIKYWNVLDRKGHTVTSYNYENSRDTFEGFAFTGLNNFDFFASEFYKEKLDD